MTKQLFEDVVGTPPPSTVDVPGLIGREKRRRATRRGAVTVTALAIAAAGVGLIDLPRGPADPAGPALQVGAAGPAQPAIRLAAEDRASAEATATALRAVLDRAVHDAVPGARWLSQNTYGNPAPDGQPPRLVGDDRAPKADQMFFGGSGVAVGADRGLLTLQVISTRPCVDPVNPKCALERDQPEREQRLRERLLLTCVAAVPDCTLGTGPRGERMLMQTVSSRRAGVPATSSATVSHEVRVRLADGRVLSLTVSNTFAAAAGRASVRQPAPPLTRRQLTGIAGAVSGHIVA